MHGSRRQALRCKGQHQRNCRNQHHAADEAGCNRHLHDIGGIAPCLFQIPRSHYITQQDAARCGHRKAKRGAEIPHHNHHGVGRHSVIAQMPQNNGVHGKRHTPGHIIAQRRQRQPDEITPQQFIGMEHFP